MTFDSVSHTIILNKCIELNIDNFWFKNYMQSRSQSVRLNNTLSNKLNITYGITQGSILGPILFFVYVNYLNERIDVSSLMQYVDDTQFLHANISIILKISSQKFKKHSATVITKS